MASANVAVSPLPSGATDGFEQVRLNSPGEIELLGAISRSVDTVVALNAVAGAKLSPLAQSTPASSQFGPD